MIITSGLILKKELQLKLSDFVEIESRVLRGQNVRIIGLDGDVVFCTPEKTQEDYIIEAQQQLSRN